MRITKSITVLTPEQLKLYRIMKMMAMKQQPYISNAFLRIIPVNAPGLGTAAIDDMWRCYIDFSYFMTRGYEFGAGVLAHEVWHLLRNHSERAERVDVDSDAKHELWNIAGDLEINDDIQHLIPEEGLIPGEDEYAHFKRDKNAEEYYFKLLDEQTSSSGGGAGSGDDDSDNSDDNENDAGDKDDSENGDNDTSDSGDREAPTCGSGAGGKKLVDYELTEEEANSVSSMEANIIRKAAAKSVQAAAKKAEEEGGENSLSESLKLWADEVLAHKPINWRKIFSNSIRTAMKTQQGQQDYVKTIPSRRQPIKGVLLPALRAPAPKVGLGIDTSGSNVEKLGVIVEEVMGIVKKAGVRGRDLLAFSVDDNIEGKPDFITSKDDISFTGSGGTELNKAFEYVADELSRKIDIFVLLTDGEYDDWLTVKPSKAKNVAFITCLVVNSVKEPEITKQVTENALNKLSSWSKVVIIDLASK